MSSGGLWFALYAESMNIFVKISRCVKSLLAVKQWFAPVKELTVLARPTRLLGSAATEVMARLFTLVYSPARKQ